MTPDRATDATVTSGRFNTTRWSLILSSLDRETEVGKAREALAQLCRIYWRPIFAYVYRRGHSVPDAQDLTQDFFLMVLKGNLLQQADRERGRFRSLLLTPRGRRANAVAKCSSWLGMNGWRKRPPT